MNENIDFFVLTGQQLLLLINILNIILSMHKKNMYGRLAVGIFG